MQYLDPQSPREHREHQLSDPSNLEHQSFKQRQQERPLDELVHAFTLMCEETLNAPVPFRNADDPRVDIIANVVNQSADLKIDSAEVADLKGHLPDARADERASMLAVMAHVEEVIEGRSVIPVHAVNHFTLYGITHIPGLPRSLEMIKGAASLIGVFESISSRRPKLAIMMTPQSFSYAMQHAEEAVAKLRRRKEINPNAVVQHYDVPSVIVSLLLQEAIRVNERKIAQRIAEDPLGYDEHVEFHGEPCPLGLIDLVGPTPDQTFQLSILYAFYREKYTRVLVPADHPIKQVHEIAILHDRYMRIGVESVTDFREEPFQLN